jgi:hypothetical protein
MSEEPTFAELVDWLDGRLDEDRAHDVAARAAVGGPDTAATIAWLRQFRGAAASMPLEQPPAEVGANARALFRQLRAPWTGDTSDLELSYDSRLVPVSGVRGGAPRDAFHVDYAGPGVSVGIDVVVVPNDERALRGAVRFADGDEPEGVALDFRARGESRGSAWCGEDGEFRARVPGEVDEIWVTGSRTRMRIGLDLGRISGGPR